MNKILYVQLSTIMIFRAEFSYKSIYIKPICFIYDEIKHHEHQKRAQRL